eukprot:CAMPEP_0194217832 /NCGR_PEP_ID=MMETSP0156-20130528/22340_1 /TAXON_ID=33649 /ORGANISM="Thalassionema nitzschioides, Strain L26-B" /LENGTH=497 /DNA_ID=CAMNT_0038946975 /DNA_START=94 /DNA_END=1588 /DNA_ORIENTATION=+
MITKNAIRNSLRRSTKAFFISYVPIQIQRWYDCLALGFLHCFYCLKLHFPKSSLRITRIDSFRIAFRPITRNSVTSTQGQRSLRNTPQDFFKETLDLFDNDEDVVAVVKVPKLTDEFDNSDVDDKLMVHEEIQVYETLSLLQFHEEHEQLDRMMQIRKHKEEFTESQLVGKSDERSAFRSNEQNTNQKKKKILPTASSSLRRPIIFLFGLLGCSFVAHMLLYKTPSISNNVVSSSSSSMHDNVVTLVEEELPRNSFAEETSIVKNTVTSSSNHDMVTLIEEELSRNSFEEDTSIVEDTATSSSMHDNMVTLIEEELPCNRFKEDTSSVEDAGTFSTSSFSRIPNDDEESNAHKNQSHEEDFGAIEEDLESSISRFNVSVDRSMNPETDDSSMNEKIKTLDSNDPDHGETTVEEQQSSLVKRRQRIFDANHKLVGALRKLFRMTPRNLAKRRQSILDAYFKCVRKLLTKIRQIQDMVAEIVRKRPTAIRQNFFVNGCA